jgi:hypothetical protein
MFFATASGKGPLTQLQRYRSQGKRGIDQDICLYGENRTLTEATTDAVELRMMEPEAKQTVDEWGSNRPFDAFLVESTSPLEINVDELIAHGFTLDWSQFGSENLQ